MTNKRYNHNWDKLLTPYQREIIAKPGFGISQQLPYLDEAQVKRVMIGIQSGLLSLNHQHTIEHCRYIRFLPSRGCVTIPFSLAISSHISKDSWRKLRLIRKSQRVSG
jgi:hypothetical protein